jgi:hypothetical protein
MTAIHGKLYLSRASFCGSCEPFERLLRRFDRFVRRWHGLRVGLGLACIYLCDNERRISHHQPEAVASRAAPRQKDARK